MSLSAKPNKVIFLHYEPSELAVSNLELALGDKILNAWKVRCKKNKRRFTYVTDLWKEDYLQKVCFRLINLPEFEKYEVEGFSCSKEKICGIIITPLKIKPKPKPGKRGFGSKKKFTSKRVGGVS